MAAVSIVPSNPLVYMSSLQNGPHRLVLLTRDKQVNRSQWSGRSSFIHWKLVEYIVWDQIKGSVVHLGKQYSKGILSHSNIYSKTVKNNETSGILTNIYSFSEVFLFNVIQSQVETYLNRNKIITLYFRQFRVLNSQSSDQ